jgi:hypothetical protein
MSSPPALTLLVPGLIWPTATLSDLTRDLALPALCRLIDSGRCRIANARPLRAALAASLGLEPPLPSAAARRLAFGLPPDDGLWLCLDPVHLAFHERQLRVDAPAKLALSAEEASALVEAIAPVFADLGAIEAARPEAWHLRLDDEARAPLNSPLPEHIGQRADDQLATLDRSWRQRLNEAQMILHSHPVNRSREERQQAVANSLWPWGAGRVPVAAKALQGGSTLPAIHCNEPDLIGLARHLGHPTGPVPGSGDAAAAIQSSLPTLPVLIGLDILDLPARQANAQDWRDKLLLLEQHWFSPLLERLSRGQLSSLRLELCGQPHSLRIDCSRAGLLLNRLSFWRPAPGTGGLAPRLDPRHWRAE